MTDCDEIFSMTAERPIIFDGMPIIRADDIAFQDGDTFEITFESTNSQRPQGIAIDVFGEISVNNALLQDKMVFWENSAPKKFRFSAYRDQKRSRKPKSLPAPNMLRIFNVWDSGQGLPESSYWGAAMTYEEIANGRRYRCNDCVPDNDFNDIVFTIQKVS